MKKGLFIFGSFLVLVGIFMFFKNNQTPVSEKPIIKIGLSLPITGPAAYAGGPSVTAAKIALDKWKNKETKYQYQLVVEDDQLSGKTTALVGKKLVEVDKVNALVSMWFLYPVLMDATKQADVVRMACAWAWENNGQQTNFNNTTPLDYLADNMAEVVRMKNAKKVAYVYPQAASDVLLKGMILDRLKAAGVEVVLEEGFQQGTKDYRTFFNKLDSHPADMIIATLLPADLNLFLKQKSQIGNKTDFTTIDFFRYMDKSLTEGGLFVSSAIGSDDFATELQKRYPQAQLGDCVANTHDSVDLLIYGFENAKTQPGQIPTAQQVADVLKDIKSYQGVLGDLSVNQDGYIVSKSTINTIQNGKNVIIK